MTCRNRRIRRSLATQLSTSALCEIAPNILELDRSEEFQSSLSIGEQPCFLCGSVSGIMQKQWSVSKQRAKNTWAKRSRGSIDCLLTEKYLQRKGKQLYTIPCYLLRAAFQLPLQVVQTAPSGLSRRHQSGRVEATHARTAKHQSADNSIWDLTTGVSRADCAVLCSGNQW